MVNQRFLNKGIDFHVAYQFYRDQLYRISFLCLKKNPANAFEVVYDELCRYYGAPDASPDSTAGSTIWERGNLLITLGKPSGGKFAIDFVYGPLIKEEISAHDEFIKKIPENAQKVPLEGAGDIYIPESWIVEETNAPPESERLGEISIASRKILSAKPPKRSQGERPLFNVETTWLFLTSGERILNEEMLINLLADDNGDGVEGFVDSISENFYSELKQSFKKTRVVKKDVYSSLARNIKIDTYEVQSASGKTYGVKYAYFRQKSKFFAVSLAYYLPQNEPAWDQEMKKILDSWQGTS